MPLYILPFYFKSYSLYLAIFTRPSEIFDTELLNKIISVVLLTIFNWFELISRVIDTNNNVYEMTQF